MLNEYVGMNFLMTIKNAELPQKSESVGLAATHLYDVVFSSYMYTLLITRTFITHIQIRTFPETASLEFNKCSIKSLHIYVCLAFRTLFIDMRDTIHHTK